MEKKKSKKCPICHRIFDKIQEYKDCIIYSHSDKKCSVKKGEPIVKIDNNSASSLE